MRMISVLQILSIFIPITLCFGYVSCVDARTLAKGSVVRSSGNDNYVYGSIVLTFSVPNDGRVLLRVHSDAETMNLSLATGPPPPPSPPDPCYGVGEDTEAFWGNVLGTATVTTVDVSGGTLSLSGLGTMVIVLDGFPPSSTQTILIDLWGRSFCGYGEVLSDACSE